MDFLVILEQFLGFFNFFFNFPQFNLYFFKKNISLVLNQLEIKEGFSSLPRDLKLIIEFQLSV